MPPSDNDSRDTRDKVIEALTLLKKAAEEQSKIDGKLENHIDKHEAALNRQDEALKGVERSQLVLGGRVATIEAGLKSLNESVKTTIRETVTTVVKEAAEKTIPTLLSTAIQTRIQETGWSLSKKIILGLAAVGWLLVEAWIHSAFEEKKAVPAPISSPSSLVTPKTP